MTEFSTQFRIYYEDTDAGGIVYHSRYLNFAERARVESLRSVGLSLPQLYKDYGRLFVVRRADILYDKPLHLDEVVTIKTRLKCLKYVSLSMEQYICRGDEICAKLDIILACVEEASTRPSPIPPIWYDTMQKAL